MHEVITLANSHSAGHVATQLYNVQELHVPYTRHHVATHSNDVFLWPVRQNGRNSYYPRNIAVEYAGGYGFLGRHAYREKPTPLDSVQAEVSAQPLVHKGQYQQSLDDGKRPDCGMLGDAGAAYWTDYNHLLYRPLLLVELPHYAHPNGQHRQLERATFSAWAAGQSEYRALAATLEDAFRANLEALDALQGVNVLLETDNAWGAFTADMVTSLRDEYFNSSKPCVWIYGLLGDAKKESLLTRIRSVVELSNAGSLFIPLAQPQGLLLTEYSGSGWHRGAVNALLLNSIWSLNCQIENPVRMLELEGQLLRGHTKRNIVNELTVRLSQPAPAPQPDFGIQDVDLSAYGFGLDKQDKKEEQNLEIQLGIASGGHRLAEFAVSTTNAPDTYYSALFGEITALPSFPPVLASTSDLSTQFGQTTALKHTLKDYRKTIQRVRAPAHLELVGDKDELVEDLSGLIDEYTVGYESESDDDY